MTHSYWGSLLEDEFGLKVERPVSLPGFQQPIDLYLGEEEPEADSVPTPDQLDAYAATWQVFLAQAPALLGVLKQQAFARYQDLYAAFYDDPALSGEPPLQLASAEAHLAYMQDVAYLRLTADQVLDLVIYYDLDPEHGLEAKFAAGQLVALGCIAEI